MRNRLNLRLALNEFLSTELFTSIFTSMNIRSTRMNYEETNLSLFRIKYRVPLIP